MKYFFAFILRDSEFYHSVGNKYENHAVRLGLGVPPNMFVSRKNNLGEIF